MPAEFDAVRKLYGDVVAVEDVSLTIRKGEFHCLVGPNGSGKTTLIRLLVGLTRPSAGSIVDPDGALGCGFQTPNFYPDLTVRENLDVFATLVGGSREWRETLLEELRLRRVADRIADDLSGGFARKLDLALALLKQPDYLLLDEPLGALDDVSQDRLLAFLGEYCDDSTTVLVSTHDVAAFEPHVDRLTIMHESQVVFDRDREAIDLDGYDSLQTFYVDWVTGDGNEPQTRDGAGA